MKKAFHNDLQNVAQQGRTVQRQVSANIPDLAHEWRRILQIMEEACSHGIIIALPFDSMVWFDMGAGLNCFQRGQANESIMADY